MNDQKMIDHVRVLLDPVTPPPDLRRKVAMAITANAQRPGRSLWARHWRFATLGATAAVGVLALIVSQVVSIGDRPPAATAEAAEILHHAAESALADPAPVPRGDQFVLTEVQTFVPVVGQAEPGIQVSRSWMSVDGSRDGLLWFSQPKPGGRQQTVIPGCRNGRAAEWTSDGGLRTDATRPCTPVPAYQKDLPTDADGMLTHLRKMSGGAQPRPDELFANVGSLIRSGYLPPRSRATLYEAATKIPGVVASPNLTDAAGRTGIGVSLSGSLDRYYLLFDPQTYQFLGWQIEPGPDAPPAQQLRREVVLTVAIVDRPGLMP